MMMVMVMDGDDFLATTTVVYYIHSEAGCLLLVHCRHFFGPFEFFSKNQKMPRQQKSTVVDPDYFLNEKIVLGTSFIFISRPMDVFSSMRKKEMRFVDIPLVARACVRACVSTR
jgi:hypothetical protein